MAMAAAARFAPRAETRQKNAWGMSAEARRTNRAAQREWLSKSKENRKSLEATHELLKKTAAQDWALLRAMLPFPGGDKDAEDDGDLDVTPAR